MIMARRKNGFDTKQLEKYAERLEAAGGHAAIKRAVNGGMLSTKREINQLITTAMQDGNLPAGGKYSTGATMEALNKEYDVNWSGNIANLPLGFDLSGAGLTSIFLMYGTPRMQPANGLHDALYGAKGRRVARKAQKKAILQVLERLGG